MVVNGGIATTGTESNHFNGNTTFNDTVNVFGSDLILEKNTFSGTHDGNLSVEGDAEIAGNKSVAGTATMVQQQMGK